MVKNHRRVTRRMLQSRLAGGRAHDVRGGQSLGDKSQDDEKRGGLKQGAQMVVRKLFHHPTRSDEGEGPGSLWLGAVRNRTSTASFSQIGKTLGRYRRGPSASLQPHRPKPT